MEEQCAASGTRVVDSSLLFFFPRDKNPSPYTLQTLTVCGLDGRGGGWDPSMPKGSIGRPSSSETYTFVTDGGSIERPVTIMSSHVDGSIAKTVIDPSAAAPPGLVGGNKNGTQKKKKKKI